MLYTMACERVLFKQGFSGTFLSDNFCWLKVSLIMQSIALLRIIVAVKYSFSQFSKYVNMDSQFSLRHVLNTWICSSAIYILGNNLDIVKFHVSLCKISSPKKHLTSIENCPELNWAVWCVGIHKTHTHTHTHTHSDIHQLPWFTPHHPHLVLELSIQF